MNTGVVAVRGHLIAAGAINSFEGDHRSDKPVPSVLHKYTCRSGHTTTVRLSITAADTPTWPCQHCDQKAHAATGAPSDDTSASMHVPAFPGSWSTKFHHSELHRRRSDEDLDALLQWARARCPFGEQKPSAA